MAKRGTTILDAARQWVGQMNSISYDMLTELMKNDIDRWHEVTTPAYGDRVYVYEVERDKNTGEITGYDEETELFHIELDDGAEVDVSADDFEVDRYDTLPMWGTLWSFGDSADDYWLEELGGIELMSRCGFRIYEHEEYGYFFGIDGAGYDFYEAHWLPLYKKRGLHWHDPKYDNPDWEAQEDEEWNRYIDYLQDWAEYHSEAKYKGMSPASFDEWRENEGEEDE